MYYKELETSAAAKRAHNKNQARNASDRLKVVASKKKAKKNAAR